MKSDLSIDELCIHTLRALSMDAVQKAKSGHPGTPMALAPVIYTLFKNHLRYDPAHPDWPNRDRFILSNGHASMVLYAILHLMGVKDSVSLNDIQNFRQLHSLCPGHPEYGLTKGVETTTGPLGQGLGNSVGMAMGALWLSAYFNRPGYELFDFKTYALCGDGDLMEGVSGEAASLAGHLQLGNLCWIYDDNNITIEGPAHLAFSENVSLRFESYGWQVLHIADANDTQSLDHALRKFQNTPHKPTLLIVKSHIAYGAPHKQDTASAHGEPLGTEEILAAKHFYGISPESFHVPREVYKHFENIGAHKQNAYESHEKVRSQYTKNHPDMGKILHQWETKEPISMAFTPYEPNPKGIPLRNAFGEALNEVAPLMPWLLGGSADLAPSTKTWIHQGDKSGFSANNRISQNIHFGVREHAMGSILNGLALLGLKPYGGTFLVFSDYMRPAIRLAALMQLPIMYVFTHDSISLGEDGPTHQPIEHLASLRAMPGLFVFRPADAHEVQVCLEWILNQAKGPCALVLSRQNVPILDRNLYQTAKEAQKGGYILSDTQIGPLQVILIATGSEVHLALLVKETLEQHQIPTRVVSLPCFELFEKQSKTYQEQVLPKHIRYKIAIEKGCSFGWERYIGSGGMMVGIDTFGASAPPSVLEDYFGFSKEKIVSRILAFIQSNERDSINN